MLESLAGVALVPMIVGLVEAAKRAGFPTRWAPLLAVTLGVVISLGWSAGFFLLVSAICLLLLHRGYRLRQ